MGDIKFRASHYQSEIDILLYEVNADYAKTCKRCIYIVCIALKLANINNGNVKCKVYIGTQGESG